MSGQQNGIVKVQGQNKTYSEVRKQLYENIIDETLFIARASDIHTEEIRRIVH